MTDKDINNKKVNSLTEFIESNHKLLTILGVFTALTIFSLNLPIKQLGYILSFIFFTLTIIVWLEIWSKFPSGSGSWKLSIFEILLSLTIIILLIYWLIDFRSIWKEFLFILFFTIIALIFTSIMKKYNIFNRLFSTTPGKRVGLRYFLGIVVVIIIFSISMYISSLISPPTNNFLDEVNKILTTPVP